MVVKEFAGRKEKMYVEQSELLYDCLEYSSAPESRSRHTS